MTDGYLNQVVEGDCLEVMRQLRAQSIDMILCDLPYGITRNEWDAVIDLPLLWQQYERVIKPTGVIALTASGIFTAKLIMSNQALFKYKIVWIKSKSTNFLNAKKQPLRKHEDICIFYKQQPAYHPQMTAGAPYDKGWRRKFQTGCYNSFKSVRMTSTGNRYPSDIVCFDEPGRSDWFYCKTAESEKSLPVHPSQKPVALGQYLIRTFSSPGDIILDNACGSGSFLVAAIKEGRKFIGIEKNQGAYYLKQQPIDFIMVCNERIKSAQEEILRSSDAKNPTAVT